VTIIEGVRERDRYRVDSSETSPHPPRGGCSCYKGGGGHNYQVEDIGEGDVRGKVLYSERVVGAWNSWPAVGRGHLRNFQAVIG